MRILYIDIDSLRPDHLGCYGYHRNTSPNIDALARNAAVFNNCYASDVPCLPSRTALFWSQFGYRTNVVNHGGQASQMNFPKRGFHVRDLHLSMPYLLANVGHHTCTISPFIDRHSAWHILHGFREYHDNGHHGHETADETNRMAIPWLKQNAKRENWFLHLNYWDPHRPYRIPESYGNPFEKDPPPSWLTQEIIDNQLKEYGPRSASCPLFFPYAQPPRKPTPREVDAIRNPNDFKKWIDGYDTGIRYADDHIGQVIQALKDEGVLDDTLIVISADHGEAQGELNTYGEHLMVDHSTARVPLIIRYPGITRGTRHDQLLYQFDFGATICEMAGATIPVDWDSRSFLPILKGENQHGRPYLVLSQGAHTCMRSVRTENWLMMRTYHPGTKPFPELQLYDVSIDPHETRDLASEKPEVMQKCASLLQDWTNQFSRPPNPCQDPFITVLAEGGPYHARAHIQPYADYLRKNGQPAVADEFLRRNHFEKPFRES